MKFKLTKFITLLLFLATFLFQASFVMAQTGTWLYYDDGSAEATSPYSFVMVRFTNLSFRQSLRW